MVRQLGVRRHEFPQSTLNHQSDLLLNSWESPKMYPPKLYSGPTIQSRFAARRAAQDLVLMKRFLFEMHRMIAVTNIWPKLLIFWNMNNFVSIPLAFVRVVSLTHKICRTQISCNKGNGTGFWFIHYRLMTANFGVVGTGLCVHCIFCATQLVKTISTTRKTQA